VTSDNWFIAGGPLQDLLFRTEDSGEHWQRVNAGPPTALPNYRPVLRLPAIQGDVLRDAVLLSSLDEPLYLAMYSGRLDSDTLEADGETIKIAEDGDGTALDLAGPYLVAAAPAQRGFVLSSDSGRSFASVERQAPDGATVTKIDVTTDGHAWALVTRRGCRGNKTECFVTSELYSSANGGQDWVALDI
jgi:hypothetical protein